MKHYEITEQEAIKIYDILMNFYDKFETLEDYAMFRKKEFNAGFSTRINLFGDPIYSDKMFSDYSIEPNDMNFSIHRVKGPKDNQIYNTLINLTTSFVSGPVPGREIAFLIMETNTNKIIGFIRLNSPTLNMKPRNVLFDHNIGADYEKLNYNFMTGGTIVPVQPFGYNYLGENFLL